MPSRFQRLFLGLQQIIISKDGKEQCHLLYDDVEHFKDINIYY